MENRKLYRLYECIPGLTTWILLIIPLILYPLSKTLTAVFFLIYVELWFFRSMKFAGQLIYGWLKSRKFNKTDFAGFLEYFSPNPPQKRISASKLVHKDFYEQLEKLKFMGQFKYFKDIYHVIILATYKEDIEILRSSIGEVEKSDYPKDKIFFVLATEERDKDRALKYSKILEEEFKGKFKGFYAFMHPKDIEGEVEGKGGNVTYAGKKITEIIKKQGIDPSNVIVTSLDADNRVSRNYFLCLTYFYLITENRKKKSYQPLPLFYNNIWQVPIVSRLIAISNSFWQMIQSVSIRNLRNFSSHAQSLDALIEMDFWSAKTIVEDGHQFWRAYFRYNGDHYVIPLFVPIYQDAVQNKSYFETLIAQYKQLRRWAWGCSDIPFVITKMKEKGRKIPFWRNFDAMFSLIEGHIMWATAPIMITISSSFSKVLRDSSDTVFVYNLSHIFSVLFTIALTGVAVSMCISVIILPRKPINIWSMFISVVQWILLPFVTIIFGSLPAIDAHTRLMLGKYLEFNVTEKFRSRVKMKKLLS